MCAEAFLFLLDRFSQRISISSGIASDSTFLLLLDEEDMLAPNGLSNVNEPMLEPNDLSSHGKSGRAYVFCHTVPLSTDKSLNTPC